MRQSSLFILTAAALTAAMGTAQESRNAAGYGGAGLSIDVDAATGGVGNLGVVYNNGLIHVSARGNGATTTPPHTVYTFDTSGALTGQYPQSALSGGSAWGWRDGATDERASGTANMWGFEAGMEIVDQAGVPVGTYESNGGTQAIPLQPVSGAVLVAAATIRGLAYDPAGNGGLGSFWTANFNSDIFEFDIAGNVLGTPLSGGWVVYGLAIDAATNNLYVSAGPTADFLVAEVDAATGIPTGNEFPLVDQTAIYGGLSIMDTPPNVPFYNAGAGYTGLVALSQGGPDRAATHRLHGVLPGVLGYDEAFLSGGINGGGQSRDGGVFFPGDTLNVLVEGNGAVPAGFPVWSVFNYQAQAGIPGVTAKAATNVDLAAPALGLGIIHEFVRQNVISLPAQDANAVIIAGGVDIATNVNIPNGSPTFPIGAGDLLAVQSLHISPVPVAGSPFKATNELFFTADVAANGIVVTAAGGNSFNADTTSGFFTVEHLGGSSAGLTIDIVELDMFASSNAGWAAGAGVFDTDQGGMADQFDAGDSTAAGCLGTFRNTSPTLVDFANAGNTASTCVGFNGSGSGFAGANVTIANSYATITIPCVAGAFGVGQTFEFDADTDGGVGIAGDAMAGIVANITLSDSSVLSGELTVDPVFAATSGIVFP